MPSPSRFPMWSLILLLAVAGWSADAHAAAKVEIAPDDANLVYRGRIDAADPKAPRIFWAGSGVCADFKATSVEVVLDDADGSNYYNAVIDGDRTKTTVIKCQKGVATYPVRSGMAQGKHRLELLRRTDTRTPVTVFKGLVLSPGGTLLKAEAPPALKIEFYGDSITSGHGILDESRAKNDDVSTWDNDQTYAAKTARALNADYRCISMSGIGVMVSWFPLTMPQMYNRLDPNDPASVWDFSRWQADIVVVNLLQNDSWILVNASPVPTEAEIVQHYLDFLHSLRAKYPKAAIFCTLGTMDAAKDGSPWPGYVEKAVQRGNAEDKDPKVFFLRLAFKNTPAHPTVSEHQLIADALIPFIKARTAKR